VIFHGITIIGLDARVFNQSRLATSARHRLWGSVGAGLHRVFGVRMMGMPPADEPVLKGHIAAGRIGALSVDTSVFDKLGRNLNSQPLLGLAQFRHGPTKFVLSEVVVGELKAHLRSHANQASSLLDSDFPPT
jgi:hypothetical protein